jgi:hypothetical protein
MFQNVIIIVFTAAVVVFVVAQPIQDMSAVSVTDKTVGIRLPRLWCRAQATGNMAFIACRN